MEIRVETQSEAWASVVGALLGAPVVAPRGLKVREAPERVSVVIASPHVGFVDVEGRRLNHAITAIEGTSLVGQCSVPELILDRVGAFAPYANDGIFWGAYGPRAAGDVGNVVELLKRDPDSRQAVISLYDSDRDLGRPSVKDVPCTIAIQFFLRPWVMHSEVAVFGDDLVRVTDTVRDLHMWVVMRSNDAWLGLPYDLGQFSLLQMAVAQALGARVGTYTHTVGSMHLYERDWEAAREIGHPRSTAFGHTFGSVDDIEVIARRCRRILLGTGKDLADLSPLEAWLTLEIGE